MRQTDTLISVVAPLSNDADIVGAFIEEVATVLRKACHSYEIVLVDDGSEDETVARVVEMLQRIHSVRLVQLSRQFGQEIAIAAGLDSVIGDYVVVMLPATDPPELLPQMIEQSQRGVGIVFGICQTRPDESLLYRLAVNIFYWYCNHVIGLSIPRNTTHFRVLSRQAVNAVTQIRDRMRYLHTLGAYIGYTDQSFPYTPIQRRIPPRRKSFWEAASLAMRIVVANSTQPLRMISWFGLALSALNVVYTGCVLLLYFLKATVAGEWL